MICDEPGDLQLETKRSGPSGTPMAFGALKTRADNVDLLFMPVYSHADLLDGLSAELRALMIGRSAFTFTPDTTTPAVLDKLAALIHAGLIATAPTSSPDAAFAPGAPPEGDRREP